MRRGIKLFLARGFAFEDFFPDQETIFFLFDLEGIDCLSFYFSQLKSANLFQWIRSIEPRTYAIITLQMRTLRTVTHLSTDRGLACGSH